MADAPAEGEAPEPPPEPPGVPAALVDGQFERVDALVAAGRVPDRAACPSCERSLYVRSGRLYPLRLFHDPSDCLLATYEGQRHLLARFALADALGRLPSLLASCRCERCGLQAGRPVPLADLGVGGGRTWHLRPLAREPSASEPDVLLQVDGQPVFTLDVYLSEALEARRAPFRLERGLPWALIDPEAALALGKRGFLPTVLEWSERPPWTCAPCASGFGHVDANMDDQERLRRLRHARGLQQARWLVLREQHREHKAAAKVAAYQASLPAVCPFTEEQLRIAAFLLTHPPDTMPVLLPPMPPATHPTRHDAGKPNAQLMARMIQGLAEAKAADAAREARAALAQAEAKNRPPPAPRQRAARAPAA